MSGPWVLMYHRVCERGADTRCWFERGTAVTPAALDRQLVTSQALYYDTFVARDPLPMNGKFQLLVNGTTEFGPGDPEYLGGRWWEDSNGNGIQDTGDHFFLCPLLPPGRPTP